MIHQINQENPQLREMHTENMRLRVSLEDHQRALEHIMSKYREHTQLALKNSKLNFQELFRGETEKSLVSYCWSSVRCLAVLWIDKIHNLFVCFSFSICLQIIQRQEEKIQEMIAVMQKAATLDDSDFEQNLKKDRENISRLIVENKGLRELLEISQKYGSQSTTNNNANDANKISVETQTDTNANQC